MIAIVSIRTGKEMSLVVCYAGCMTQNNAEDIMAEQEHSEQRIPGCPGEDSF
jgi:hypothetical protein